MKKILFILVGVVLVGWIWFVLGKEQSATIPENFENAPLVVPKEEVVEVVPLAPVAPPKPVIRDVEHLVPFTSQAPTGDWSKSAFQDGCEEASALMVHLARSGETLTPAAARQKLLDMAEFQTEHIGHGVDTDVSDTREYLLNQYFEIPDSEVKYDFTLEDLRVAVMEGLVIVPTNGRALGNPNFTPPGPLEHMLVIKGYDTKVKEFITNDPGTRKGEGYRYPEQILYDAIREYPTGKHLPITAERKAMIVVPFSTP